MARREALAPAALSRRSRFWFWIALLSGTGTFLGGVIGELLHIDGGRTGSYFGILVLGTAFIALLSAIAELTGWRSALLAALGCLLIGAGFEVLGLYGSLPFGRYEYTDWWLPYVTLPGGKLFPLLLPFTWFILVALWYLLLARRWHGWRLVLGTGLFAALTDIALEPVLTRVVLFWHWLEPTPFFGAPYQNPVGWFVVASAAAAWLQLFRIERARSLPHPRWLVPAGLLFTAVLGLVYGEPRGALALLLILPVSWFGWDSSRN